VNGVLVISYVHPYIMQHLPIGIVKLGTTTPEESGQVSLLIHTVRKPAFSCLLSHPAFTHLVRYGSCLEEETISGKIMEEIR